MSLKDRLKKKNSQEIQKKSPDAQNVASDNRNWQIVQKKIYSQLIKKIYATQRWQNYTEAKQQQFIKEYLQKQLDVNYPSIQLEENDLKAFIETIMNETGNFGILEPLIKKSDINYILVNGAKNIYVEKDNKLLKTKYSFSSAFELKKLINNISQKVGCVLNENNPILDTYYSGGYHITAILPPISAEEPCLTIRKINVNKCNLENLFKDNVLSLEMSKFLETAVQARANIIVTGLKGAGKTTLLNCLCNKISQTERAAIIEDAQELTVSQKNIIHLKTQFKDDTKDNYVMTASNLIKNVTKMRPDRIILGECKSCETYDFLQLLNSGYEGSMSTIFSKSTNDAVNRIEAMILSCTNFDHDFIQKEIANSIDLIVEITKMPDGKRKITKISEPISTENGILQLQDIFIWEKEVEMKKSRWIHMSTGVIPKFLKKPQAEELNLNKIIFNREYAHTYSRNK